METIELRSWKGKKKWTHVRKEQKTAYIEAIIQHTAFRHTFFSRRYVDTIYYEQHVIETIADGVHSRIGRRTHCKIDVRIDGLGKTERFRIAHELRRKGVRVDTMRGPKDENDPFIRLADALAGLVRDAWEGEEYAMRLLQKAKRHGLFLE